MNGKINYFGWFWDSKDQTELKKIAFLSLAKVLEFSSIKNSFLNGHNSTNPLHHWKMVDTQLHVTSKFCRGKNPLQNSSYYEIVRSSINKQYKIMIKGFLLTDKTFSGCASVEKDGEKLLQNAESGYNELDIVHVTLACATGVRPVQCKYDHMEASSLLKNISKLPKVHAYDSGSIKKLSKNCFFIELNQPLSYTTTFKSQ